MSNFVTSLIRTWVPIAVGVGLTWLAEELGVVIDDSMRVEVAALATGVVIAAYYLVARVLERKWPALGFLLGSTSKPTYVAPR